MRRMSKAGYEFIALGVIWAISLCLVVLAAFGGNTPLMIAGLGTYASSSLAIIAVLGRHLRDEKGEKGR